MLRIIFERENLTARHKHKLQRLIPSLTAPKTFCRELQKWIKTGYKGVLKKLVCFPYLCKDHLSSSHLLDLNIGFVLFQKHFYPCCLKTGDLGPNPRRECRVIPAVPNTNSQPAATFQRTALILHSKAFCIHSLHHFYSNTKHNLLSIPLQLYWLQKNFKS